MKCQTAYKYLKRRDIYYLGDLRTYTKKDLLKGQDFGIKTLHELECILEMFDIKLKEK